MTPEELRAFADRIQALRFDVWSADETALSAESGEHYLSALAHLDLAVRSLRLATYTLMQKR